MSTIQFIPSSPDGWEKVHGEHGIHAEYEERFASMFPHGHATTIRVYLEHYLAENAINASEERAKEYGLENFHPRAVELLCVHGIDYTPYDWARALPHGANNQPEPGRCFANSSYFMNEFNSYHTGKTHRRKVYVEGLCIGAFVVPMLHAWNASSVTDTVAQDWTFYVCTQWVRYLGIPVTQEEHNHMCRLVWPDNPTRSCVFLSKNHFPIVEEYLTTILAQRSEQTATHD